MTSSRPRSTRRGRAVATAVVLAVAVAAMTGTVARGASSVVSTSRLSGVWVEPNASYGFLDRAVLGARRTIDMSMYELSDSALQADLVARARSGVIVRVLLDSAYEERSSNSPAAAALRRGGVQVRWAPSGQIFHAKYLVVDHARAYIGTGNLTSYWYSSTRDYWVEDAARRDVSSIETVFDADFAGRAVSPSNAGPLVWSPGSTGDLVALIGSAKHSLLVENEEMDSTPIESALEAAAQRGVDVEVVMTSSSQWVGALRQLSAAGVHVHTIPSSSLYVHAKAICADCSRAGAGTLFLGSENFSTSSLVYNRELGVVTNDRSVVATIDAAMSQDYRTGSG